MQLIREGAGCEWRYHIRIRAQGRFTLQNDFVGDDQPIDSAASANGHRAIGMHQSLIHAHIVANGDAILLAIQSHSVRKNAVSIDGYAAPIDKGRLTR